MDSGWKPFVCVDCRAGGIQRAGRGSGRLRCDACIKAYKNADRRNARAGHRSPRECLTCGSEVERGSRLTYCSPKCRLGTKPCAHCGKTFAPERDERRFCSPTCSYATAKGIAPGWLNQPRTLPCGACGTEVTTGGTKTLCVPCRALRQREHWQGKNRRRRAALQAVASERYTLTEIAERDEHLCQLCCTSVDMSLVVPDLGAPTIDHVVSLFHGGDDTRANVQLAHFGCNSRKGAGAPQRLALAG